MGLSLINVVEAAFTCARAHILPHRPSHVTIVVVHRVAYVTAMVDVRGGVQRRELMGGKLLG